MFVFNGGKRKKWINFLGIFIAGSALFGNVMITTYVRDFNAHTFLFDLVILLIFSVAILNCRWHLILASFILCYLLLIAGNVLGLEIIHWLLNIDYVDLMGTNTLYTFVTLIICKILWILFLSFPLYLRKNLKERNLTVVEITALLAMGGITIILVTIFLLFVESKKVYLTNTFILFIWAILILDGLICWLLMVVTMQKNKLLQIEYLKKNIEDQKNMYYRLLQNVDEIRKQKHNVTNVLISLKMLVDKKEYNSLASAVNQTLYEFSDYKVIDSSNENAMWLAIIDYKKQVALQNNIIFETDIEYGDYTAVRGIDSCVILGNLIDNAIEAEQKEKEYKKIRIAVKNDFGAVYFCVKNYISHSVLKENKNYLHSSKAQPEEHGYGLRTVIEIVNQYNGEFKIEEKNDYFCVEILLYPR